jgi:hypothetical protein
MSGDSIWSRASCRTHMMYPHSIPPLHGLNEAAPTPTGMLDAYVVYVTVEAQTDSTRSASSRCDDIRATRPMFRRVGGHAGGSRQRCQLSYGMFLTDVASLSAHSRGVIAAPMSRSIGQGCVLRASLMARGATYKNIAHEEGRDLDIRLVLRRGSQTST